jgi:hypothetical protein
MASVASWRKVLSPNTRLRVGPRGRKQHGAFDPLLGGFFERLAAEGQSRMAAVGACLRKLLMIAYGVLKNRVPVDPSWGGNSPLDNTPSCSAGGLPISCL